MTAVPTSSMVGAPPRAGSCRRAMLRSTFSTTTMASSTTMPIARIRPNSVSMFTEKPSHGHDGEGADQRDRDGEDRDDRGAEGLQEDEDDDDDEDDRLDEGLLRPPRSRRRRTRSGCRRSSIRARGEAPLELLHLGLDGLGGGQGVGARPLLNGEADARDAVEIEVGAVAAAADLDARDVAQAQDPAVGGRLDDHVLELGPRPGSGPVVVTVISTAVSRAPESAPSVPPETWTFCSCSAVDDVAGGQR